MFRNTYVMLFLRCSISFKLLSTANYLKSQRYCEKTKKLTATADCFERQTMCFVNNVKKNHVRLSIIRKRKRTECHANGPYCKYSKGKETLSINKNDVNWRRVWLILIALQRPDVQISIHLKTLLWNGLLTAVPILTKVISVAVIFCPLLLNDSFVASLYFPLYSLTQKHRIATKYSSNDISYNGYIKFAVRSSQFFKIWRCCKMKY